ncbi:MarR family winged helix-turn-helix transcriptional regulator [Streptomyces turgidiscabies]|uniref:DNA-binding MarR family transcriptional regulator n=1 Tax=Streptomyces turgidiscabies TaxID=85558 RepID=A0ABU0RQG8_9ACTN|nr:MarR family transcriptional regulator [Streptomyces turgidiscabies]MDQ0934222.1 DNA-binding MarR family transcriptional regulator [Streptomyces turgidiscabies]
MTDHEPRWLDETEMRAWNGFLLTASLIARMVDAQLSETGGVSRVQYEILTRIHASPGRRHRMTELAERMVFSRSGMTYQVAQLEKAGLLRRETDLEDERGVLAILTDEGQRVLEAAAPGHLATVREGFVDLLSPEQISQLADIMDITSGHLRATVPVTPPRKAAKETP